MIFSDLIGIMIFAPAFVFISLYGLIAVYRIFDQNI